MDLLPESITVIILARLQIRDIARIKVVCREWKSLLESSYFREVYKTINQKNLSSPWSILYKDQFSTTALEFFCERWGFTQSIVSCVSRFLDDVKAANKTKRVGVLASTDGLVLLDMSTKFGPDTFSVANPVLRQLINIPEPPHSYQYSYQGTALVTNMNNGDLLGYKVVRYGLVNSDDSLYFEIYSSDSGNWTCQVVGTNRQIYNRLSSNPINLNGYLHWLCRETQSIIAHNFYATTEVCLVYLPHRFFEPPKKDYGETLTISCGSLMYMRTDSGRQQNQQLKIWRLKNYTSGSSMDSWELLWGLRLGLFPATEPVAMHPFVEEIIYLVTRQTDYSETHAYLVSGNLHTKKFQLHEDWKQEHRDFGDYQSHLFHQFILPQRIRSIPCPPGCTIFTFLDYFEGDFLPIL